MLLNRAGISSWCYAWAIGVDGHPRPSKPLTVFDLVLEARRLEVPLIQIADNLPLDKLSDSELRQLAECAREAGVSVEVGTRGVEPDRLLRYLEIATILKSRLVRTLTHSNASAPGLDEVRHCLATVLPAFDNAGVFLGLENYERHTCAELASLIDDLESPWLGVCLDTVNSLGSLETPAQVLSELGRYTINVHVKDFDICRIQGMMGFAVVGRPAGEGRLEVASLLNQLDAMPQAVSVVLELWPPVQSDIAGTIALEREWVDRSIAYLKATTPTARTKHD